MLNDEIDVLNNMELISRLVSTAQLYAHYMEQMKEPQAQESHTFMERIKQEIIKRMNN